MHLRARNGNAAVNHCEVVTIWIASRCGNWGQGRIWNVRKPSQNGNDDVNAKVPLCPNQPFFTPVQMDVDVVFKGIVQVQLHYPFDRVPDDTDLSDFERDVDSSHGAALATPCHNDQSMSLTASPVFTSKTAPGSPTVVPSTSALRLQCAAS